MRVSITDARERLTELVRHAEAGHEVVLTRQGHAAVRLVAMQPRPVTTMRRAAIATARQAALRATPGPDAARSQDGLYGEDGLPG